MTRTARPRLHIRLRVGLLASTASLLGALEPACAQDNARDSIGTIETRIHRLEAELAAVQKNLAAHRHQVEAANRNAIEAEREAREANRRATAATLAGAPGNGQSFSGAAPGGFAGFRGEAVTQEAAPNNGLGGHMNGTVGEQKASALGDFGRFQLGGVTVQLGGFIDATSILRTRNTVADVTTSWNSIPYRQSPLYHEPEFRGSARNSRLALLIEGNPSPVSKVSAYFETDFKAAGISSNSNESNSYAMSLRLAYATYDRTDWGLHVLAGQAWSLVTLNRVGLTPRQEQIPLTIDAGYVPGFNWLRVPELRIDKDFLDHRLWLGIAFDSPETSYYVNNANNTGVIGGTPNYVNTGGSLLNSTANYSDDIAPDVIAKIAVDPSYGHYELYGLGRFFHDRVTSTTANVAGRDNTVLGGGVGAGFILPLLGPRLTFQASGLVGQGIGRYGEAQLPDATLNQNGTPIPLPEVQGLLGLVYHPVKVVDLYAYAGTEQIGKRSYNETTAGKTVSYGYGNGDYSDAGCDTEGSALTCVGNTRGITQGTLGGWWRFLHGNYGTLQSGVQWSYTQRTAFEGVGATKGSEVTPKTDENIIMFSFRYLPFL